MTLDHIVLMSGSVEKSAVWYGAVLAILGFEPLRENVWISPSGFAVDLRQATSEAAYDRYSPGLNHLALRVETREELERIRRETSVVLREEQTIQGFGEIGALFLRDPDGLRLELVHYAPAR